MRERHLILIGLAIVSAYDVLTTIFGTISILGPTVGSTMASILLGGIIGGLMYYSYEIHNSDKSDLMVAGLNVLWFIAVAYDLYTSFMGNNRFIILGALESREAGKLVILLGLTAFVTSCPIIWSYLRNNDRFMTGGTQGHDKSNDYREDRY